MNKWLSLLLVFPFFVFAEDAVAVPAETAIDETTNTPTNEQSLNEKDELVVLHAFYDEGEQSAPIVEEAGSVSVK